MIRKASVACSGDWQDGSENNTKPGENGTKLLLRQYGDQLVCVRYRYDRLKRKSYKTVELIVEVKDWIPDTLVRPDKPVSIRVDFNEIELRSLIKNAGGYWNPKKKVWVLSYMTAHDLGLERRILGESCDL